ncbi:ANTAR domain-containing response regulator [Ampullimonas aquatilis]|uniref:ANTAR domain-containing response regulator n=1 Tax=Ampullimonas aquatilis TaxID=1341549 RepID=UPI003C7383C3
MQSLRIILVKDPADGEPTTDIEALATHLKEQGYQLIATVDADIMLPERVAQLQPDLIMIESEAAGRDVLEHVCVSTISAPRPIVLFTDNSDTSNVQRAIASGITGYVVDGLQPERVKPVLDVAIARFQLEQSLRQELDETRTQLAERKIIEKAKGILMQNNQLSEEQAYKKMRSLAMDKNLRLIEVAQRVIDFS